MADYSGRTPLMCAICGYHTDLAKLLIYRGADIHMEDNDKENALSLSTKAIMSSNKMRKGGGPTNKRVIHQDCDCARCESHSVIAALLVRRGGIFMICHLSSRFTQSFCFSCQNPTFPL